MKKTLLLILCVVVFNQLKAAANFTVYDLRCEQQAGVPVGISCAAPSFSWKLNSTDRGVMQQAFQIVVAESPSSLSDLAACTWNSGRMETDKTTHITYKGAGLRPATRYYWVVRSWNQRGDSTAWSRPAAFITGMEGDADWGKARWIAMEKDRERIVPAIHVVDIKSRLKPEDKPGMYLLQQFRKVVNVKKELRLAVAYVAGLGQFDFYIGGRKVGDHFLDPGWRCYDSEVQYVGFDVTFLLHKGENVLGVMLGNGFYNIPRERYMKLLQSYGAPKLRFCLVLRYSDGSEERIVGDKIFNFIID